MRKHCFFIATPVIVEFVKRTVKRGDNSYYFAPSMNGWHRKTQPYETVAYLSAATS